MKKPRNMNPLCTKCQKRKAIGKPTRAGLCRICGIALLTARANRRVKDHLDAPRKFEGDNPNLRIHLGRLKYET